MNVAIIQARTESTRLPNKVMMKLEGKPMLEHVIRRVRAAKLVDRVIVATTSKDTDDVIASLCTDVGVCCYRGSENDVLDRYYQAALIYKADNIIRITADCPLIDPSIIDSIVCEHKKGNYDYTSNTLEETFPDGLDTEVFKFSVLEEAWSKASLLSEREHVTPYIKFKGHFRRKSITIEPSLGEMRWTVDTDRDYEFVLRVYNDLYDESSVFCTEDVIRWIGNHPEVSNINSGIIRNEGYIKSIKNDREIR